MIRIIKGTYGYVPNPKTGRVYPKTSKSEPFSTSPEEEARLVGLKVAVYVDEPADITGKEPGKESGTDAAASHLDPEQLAELTNAKLKELAEEMGIDTKKLTTKAKLIEAITAVEVTPGPAVDDGEDDGEPLPSFDPTEAVK